MFKNSFIFISVMVGMVVFSGFVMAITVDEIINRRDDNEFFTSARIEAEMIVVKGNRKMVKEMVSISDGENSLTEFTNPGDRGTKYLKRGDKLWMFFPDAEDLVPISGHMLEQSMMGSDFSYKDMMESDKLTELYNFEIIGEEKIKYGEEEIERLCYILEGIKKEGKEDVQYYRRKMWIDKERFIGVKEELYAQSGRLLKVSKITKIEEIEGRWFPMESFMEDKLQKNSRTEFIINSIEFNPEIPEGTFTLENLQS